ncbi:site-specific integrase [Draconibacterium mangrovi]|uniref:site-specific integrase n=1 Tax=Draconibacterium mangrovi TaxID=2697469 RepID=UPI0013D562FF|nr:site-specific integrase [Draconibacterium mangrovi]
MKKNLTTLFFLRGARTPNSSEANIYVRINLNGERAELSIGRKIDPQKWNSKMQRVIGRSETARTLNDYLDTWDNTIKRAFNKLLDNQDEVSASILRDMVTGKFDKNHTLIKVFEKNNQLIKLEEGAKYGTDQIKRYGISIERLKAFISEDLGLKDIRLDKLNHDFIRRYEIFLRTKYNYSHNTTMKYLKQLKRVIHFAMEQDYIEHDPFFNYKTAEKEVKREVLTEDELARIEKKNFRIKRLEEVKDIFLFVCYTGLSYSDLKLLSKDNLSIGIDGKHWIEYKRKKTGIQVKLRLLPIAKQIIDKYNNDEQCLTGNKLLPVKSNQKLNLYLSEIAELCEIDKKISMHIGRHTFATTVTLTNGVPIETVSKMLGHKSLKTTQIYSKVVDTKISNEMEQLEKILASKGETGQELEVQSKKSIV